MNLTYTGFFRTLCKKISSHVPAFLFLGFICLITSGCISRILEIRTDPPGARVFIEGKEIGTSPAEFTFDHYGERDLLITCATQDDETIHYAPVREKIDISCPWWGYFPIDFLVDVLPFTVTDRQEISYTLVNTQEEQKSLEQIKRDMNKMQDRLLEDN